MRLHSLRVEAVVAAESASRLTETSHVEGLLVALAERCGPGQSSYDPTAAPLSGPEGGLSAACVFPGGHATVHTYAAQGRLPGRYIVEVTASEPVTASDVITLAERRLGIPSDYTAASLTRGWGV